MYQAKLHIWGSRIVLGPTGSRDEAVEEEKRTAEEEEDE